MWDATLYDPLRLEAPCTVFTNELCLPVKGTVAREGGRIQMEVSLIPESLYGCLLLKNLIKELLGNK